MDPLTITKTVILDKPADWDIWFHTVKTMATISSVDIWKYINPDLDIEPQLPIAPEPPTVASVDSTMSSIAELDTAGIQKYDTMIKNHQVITGDINRKLQAIGKVLTYINTTISQKNMIYIQRKNTVYQMLVALKQRLAPKDRARKTMVIRQYDQLKVYQKNEPVESWLQTWERVYQDAKDLKLAVADGEQPLFDFINAIRPIDPYFAPTMEYDIAVRKRERKDVDLYDMIEMFRDHYRDNTMPSTHSSMQNYLHQRSWNALKVSSKKGKHCV
jgi:hypothetical protein